MKINNSLCIFLVSLTYSQINGEDFKIPNFDYLKDNVNKLIVSSQNTSIIWDRLAEMTDLYGHRITGSKSLEDSIGWIKEKMIEDGLHVYTQDVTADYWQRNKESLVFHSPTRGSINLRVLGQGVTKPTPKEGITGEVVTIISKADIKVRGEKGELKGKIVLCNLPYTGNKEDPKTRAGCAALAEPYGAIAVLVRFGAPFSVNTVHTGIMYESKIPGAVVSMEDAEMLTRIEKRAKNATAANRHIFKKPIVTLKLGAKLFKNQAKTRNLIAEVKGSEKPEEIIIVSGHIDSWDVGVGVNDDAGGAFVAWEVLRQLVKLGIKPRRTIRAIFFVDEEHGGSGSTTYYNSNLNNLENHILAMESDFGSFEPYGFLFAGNKEATAIFTAIGKQLLGHTTFNHVEETIGGAGDIDILCSRGVPCAQLSSKSDNKYERGYHTFYHADTDRMEAVRPDQLGRNAAMTAGFIYAVADLKEILPKVIVPESKQDQK